MSRAFCRSSRICVEDGILSHRDTGSRSYIDMIRPGLSPAKSIVHIPITGGETRDCTTEETLIARFCDAAVELDAVLFFFDFFSDTCASLLFLFLLVVSAIFGIEIGGSNESYKFQGCCYLQAHCTLGPKNF